MDYCSQLYMPVCGGKLADIENLQRDFTSQIPSVKQLDYWTRLKNLQLLSQQRRLERYRFIYVGKLLKGGHQTVGYNKLNTKYYSFNLVHHSVRQDVVEEGVLHC